MLERWPIAWRNRSSPIVLQKKSARCPGVIYARSGPGGQKWVALKVDDPLCTVMHPNEVPIGSAGGLLARLVARRALCAKAHKFANLFAVVLCKAPVIWSTENGRKLTRNLQNRGGEGGMGKPLVFGRSVQKIHGKWNTWNTCGTPSGTPERSKSVCLRWVFCQHSGYLEHLEHLSDNEVHTHI